MIYYLEASAAAKLLVHEAHTTPLKAFLDDRRSRSDRLVSSVQLETELRRLAQRMDLEQAQVTALLQELELLVLEHMDFRQAGLLAGRHLRSPDALHIAAALRLRTDALLTYDRRQADAAMAIGLDVVSPGA